MDVPTALWPHEVSVAPRWRGAMMPLIDPTLVGAVLAHEVVFDVVDAPLETVTEPKLKIDAAQKSTKEFLRPFTVPPFQVNARNREVGEEDLTYCTTPFAPGGGATRPS
jgi:hypothetical protein